MNKETFQNNVSADKIDMNKLPAHIAVIMDGNGRWQHSMAKRGFLATSRS